MMTSTQVALLRAAPRRRKYPFVNRRNYLTGMTALNLPHPSLSGDWHRTTHFGAHVDPHIYWRLARLHLMDTSRALGGRAIYDCADLVRPAMPDCPRPLWAATHARAYVDLVMNCAARGRRFDMRYPYDVWFEDGEAESEILPLMVLAAPRLLPKPESRAVMAWFLDDLAKNRRKAR